MNKQKDGEKYFVNLLAQRWSVMTLCWCCSTSWGHSRPTIHSIRAKLYRWMLNHCRDSRCAMILSVRWWWRCLISLSWLPKLSSWSGCEFEFFLASSHPSALTDSALSRWNPTRLPVSLLSSPLNICTNWFAHSLARKAVPLVVTLQVIAGMFLIPIMT